MNIDNKQKLKIHIKNYKYLIYKSLYIEFNFFLKTYDYFLFFNIIYMYKFIHICIYLYIN